MCETQVACGATSDLPNLVDGTLRTLPTKNSSSHTGQTCLMPGHAFDGYYRTNDRGTGIEVQLESTVDKAVAMHRLQQFGAPFILGTGSLAVLGSLVFLVYYLCVRTVSDEVHEGFGDCWGPSPTWRSEYAMVKGGSSCKTVEEDDICRVCHFARCGEVEFTNCGHAVVCLTCSGLLSNCPVCSQPISGIRIDQNMLL